MQLTDYQRELRQAYARGGVGAIVSGLVWLAAGLTASQTSIPKGFAVLFFGGMFIFPISKLIMSAVVRRPSVSQGNPGGLVVIETVFPMIAGLFAAWLLMPHRPEFVFGMSAIAVGTHYFGFRTAYGDWIYWAFGAILSSIGFSSIAMGAPGGEFVPFVVAIVEVLFGIGLLVADRREIMRRA